MVTMLSQSLITSGIVVAENFNKLTICSGLSFVGNDEHLYARIPLWPDSSMPVTVRVWGCVSDLAKTQPVTSTHLRYTNFDHTTLNYTKSE